MVALSYDEMTAAATRTLRRLSEESAGQLSEDTHSWWDMARGAIRCWEESVGDYARPEDRRHLALLLAEMSCRDESGSGNWHLPQVVRF